MREAPQGGRAQAYAVLAFAVALLLFASPLRTLWLSPRAGWLAPFVAWGLVIALTAASARRRG